MAVEYRLTLAGETPMAAVAARALPDTPERVEPYKRILTGTVTGQDDTFRRGLDNQLWEWELAAHVHVTLDVGTRLYDTATRTMLDIVVRVLTRHRTPPHAQQRLPALTGSTVWPRSTGGRCGGTTTAGRTRSSPADPA
jgi:hypothetical protein